jgi:hypothetical protein
LEKDGKGTRHVASFYEASSIDSIHFDTVLLVNHIFRSGRSWVVMPIHRHDRLEL